MMEPLPKGQRLDLTQACPDLRKLNISVTWNETPHLDLSALVLDAQGKLSRLEDLYYFDAEPRNKTPLILANRGKTSSGFGQHLRLLLDRLPAESEGVVLCLSQRQNVPWPSSMKMRFSDEASGKDLFVFPPTPEQPDDLSLIVGRFYIRGDRLRFQVIQEGYPEGLGKICSVYGMDNHAIAEPVQPPEPEPEPVGLPIQTTQSNVPVGPLKIQQGHRVSLPEDDFHLDFNWGRSGARMMPAAFLLRGHKEVESTQDFVRPDQVVDPSGSVHLATSEGSCRFSIRPEQIPSDVDRVVIAAALDPQAHMGRTMGMLPLEMRLLGGKADRELGRTQPDWRMVQERALLLGEYYRRNGEWKFLSMLQGIPGGMVELLARFGILARSPQKQRITQTGYRRINQEADAAVTYVATRGHVLARQRLRDQIEILFGNPGYGVLEYNLGQANLEIYVVEPGADRPHYTLITHGVAAMDDDSQALGDELILCLPNSWPMDSASLKDNRHAWPIRILHQLAKSAHEGRKLTIGALTDSGEQPGQYGHTRFRGYFLYLPTVSAGFEDLTVSSHRKIQYLSPYLLLPDELGIAREQGADHIYQLLSDQGVTELIDPNRGSVLNEEPKRSWIDRLRSRD